MRIYLALGLTIAALSGLLYWQIGEAGALKSENKALTEASEQAASRAKSDASTLVARQAELALKQRELAKAQEALSRALQRNKTWSDTDVPTEVQEALGGPSSGLPARVQHD